MSRRGSDPVIVIPYDGCWLTDFGRLREVLQETLGGMADAVEHVGSTSVPGLAAKPIIDIDIVISSRAILPAVIPRLEGLGYRHEGDLGIEGREAFSRDGADVPRHGDVQRWPDHHLYVCSRDSIELQRHLAFRDWLRSHPDRAAEYGALKIKLSEAYKADRLAYSEAKNSFIESALFEAGVG